MTLDRLFGVSQRMAARVAVLVAVVFAAAAVSGLNNGLARTPQMGWNRYGPFSIIVHCTPLRLSSHLFLSLLYSWYDLMCSDSMNETTIIATMDAMSRNGLQAAGFKYINLDDCWCGSRDPHTGAPISDPVKFPSGIKYLADYAHAHGFMFGVYTDRGTETCGGRPGSHGYETIDAQTYAAWGVDYVKEDSCYAPDDPSVAFPEYAAMRDALNATGRQIFFSLCGWHDWYASVGASLGNSWRTGQDDSNWPGVKINIDVMMSGGENGEGLAQYAAPGGINDPCLLLSTDWQGNSVMTEQQTRTQFSMWAILASPMLISGNVRDLELGSANLLTYTNAEVIAIGQDPLVQQGVRVAGGATNVTVTNVWARQTLSGVAMVFMNPSASITSATCDVNCFQRAGFNADDVVYGRDLWAHQDRTSLPLHRLSIRGFCESLLILFLHVM